MIGVQNKSDNIRSTKLAVGQQKLRKLFPMPTCNGPALAVNSFKTWPPTSGASDTALPEPKRFFILNAQHRAQVLAPLKIIELIEYVDKLEAYRQENRERIEAFTKLYKPILQTDKVDPEAILNNGYKLNKIFDISKLELPKKDDAGEENVRVDGDADNDNANTALTAKASALQEKILKYDPKDIESTIEKLNNYLEAYDLKKFLASKPSTDEPKIILAVKNDKTPQQQQQHQHSKQPHPKQKSNKKGKVAGHEEEDDINIILNSSFINPTATAQWIPGFGGERSETTTVAPSGMLHKLSYQNMAHEVIDLTGKLKLVTLKQEKPFENLVATTQKENAPEVETSNSEKKAPTEDKENLPPFAEAIPSSIQLAAMAAITNAAIVDVNNNISALKTPLAGHKVYSTPDNLDIQLFVSGQRMPLPKVFNTLSEMDKIAFTRNLPETARGKYLNLCWENILFNYLAKTAGFRLGEN